MPKLNPYRYYILDFSDFNDSGLLSRSFTEYEHAELYIRRNILNTKSVKIVGGYKAIKLKLKFFPATRKKAVIPTKYKYPPDVDTPIKRKYFRRIFRYHFWGTYPKGHKYNQDTLRKLLE